MYSIYRITFLCIDTSVWTIILYVNKKHDTELSSLHKKKSRTELQYFITLPMRHVQVTFGWIQMQNKY